VSQLVLQNTEAEYKLLAPAARVAFLGRPPRLDAALVLLSLLSTLTCLARLLPRVPVLEGGMSLSPRSALRLRVDLVLRPVGLCDCRLPGGSGGEDDWSRVADDRADVRAIFGEVRDGRQRLVV